jgi:ATP-dependent DNA helicase RecQ
VGARTLEGVRSLAETVFAFPSLRSHQERVLVEVLDGRDTLAVLATGSGKSAIYQLAGLTLGGLTVVVSPLIALQRDQLRSLSGRALANGVQVRSGQLNSKLSIGERRSTEAALLAGELDFLLLGPEQLVRTATRELLIAGKRACRLLAVDEAHLVSEWGFDFRPDYLQIGELRGPLGNPQVLALTATAAPPVQSEITRRLEMRDPAVVVAGFDRPNITLAVRPVHGHDPNDRQRADDLVVQEVVAGPRPALVYAATQEHTEDLAVALRQESLRAMAYHAGLPGHLRSSTQDAFLAGDLDVVVATSAFGMGIDKADVRSVVHASPPGSLDEYYQEVGRAGRDGLPARAILVFNPADLRLPRLFAAAAHVRDADVDVVLAVLSRCNGLPVSLAELGRLAGLGVRRTERVVDRVADAGAATLQGTTVQPTTADLGNLAEAAAQAHRAEDRRQAIATSRIDAVRYYAETTGCRRTELLAYFGEHYEPPCHACDNDSVGEQTKPSPPTVGQPAAPWSALAPGSHVRHRVWGDGVILSADPHQLLAAFDRVGYKHLTPGVLTNGILTLVS